MKCEICGKDILKDSQCIDYKYYHNDYIINLTKENQKLQQRIEKAIEYIKANKEEIKFYEPYGTPTGMPNRIEYHVKGYLKILEILKGVE